MKIDAIIISVLYNHFYNMKLKGRNVVPWFQTIFVIVLYIALAGSAAVKIVMDIKHGGYYQTNENSSNYLYWFLGFMILLFFIIKRKYFDNGKHIIFYEAFIALPEEKINNAKWILFLSMFLIIAILFGVVYLDAVKYQ